MRLSDEVHQRLKDRAWERRMSMEALARELLDEQPPGPRKPVIKAPTNMTPTLAAKRIRDEKGNRL